MVRATRNRRSGAAPAGPLELREVDDPALGGSVQAAGVTQCPTGQPAVEDPRRTRQRHGPCVGDPRRDRRGSLRFGAAHERERRDARHRDPQVDPVAQRPRYAPLVTLRDERRAAAGSIRAAGEPARARVHRRDQLEPRREDRRATDPRDRDPTLLHRLAERLEDVAPELGQLVEEQDALVGEGDLARRHVAVRHRPSPHTRSCGAATGTAGGGAARGSDPRPRPKRRPSPPAPRDRRAAAAARDRPRQQRLARPGRPDEQEAVAAGQGDLQSAPRLGLAADLAQVRHRPTGRCDRSDGPLLHHAAGPVDELDPARRGDDPASTARPDHLDRVRERLDPADLDPLDETRLVDRGRGDHDPPQAAPGQRGDHRQDAGHRPHLAAERQLADQRDAARRRP